VSILEKRKIVHSYVLVFYQFFIDRLVLHPAYELIYTLEVDNGDSFFNSALNFTLSAEELGFELNFIETFFGKKQKKSSIGLLQHSQSDEDNDLINIIEERNYKYNSTEDVVFFLKSLTEREKAPPESSSVHFKIVQDFKDFYVYLETAREAWDDKFDYTKYANALSKRYTKRLDGIENYHIIGFIDDTPVCTSTLSTYYGDGHLLNISVLPKFRRQGIASDMINYASTILLKSGHKKMTICIDGMDDIASKVLKSNGFSEEIKLLMYTQNAKNK